MPGPAAAAHMRPLTQPGVHRRLACSCHILTPGSYNRQPRSLSFSSYGQSGTAALQPLWRHHQQQQQQQQLSRLVTHAAPEGQQQQQQQGEGERQVVYSREFGYSRKDVLIIIVALIGLGVLMYEGLQAMGMDAGIAGNWVQATIFLGICVGWVSTYLWRVANKKMTYAQQLQMYESAVMQKRLEEMTEAELARLLEEVEADKARLASAKEELTKRQQQQQQPGAPQ